MLAFSSLNMKITHFVLQTLFFSSLLINFALSDDLATKLRNVRNYKGPLASVFTPFKDDAQSFNQSLNLSAIPRYAKFLSSKNVNGVLVAGTMGEGTSLSVKERKKLAEAWADVVKETKQHLMLHVGGTTLKNVKELAVHAESIGVDSILVSPDPSYVKHNSVEDVVDYLKLISKVAPKIPLLYYQNPTFGVDIDVAKLLATVGEKVPTFAGMKHVTGDSAELSKAWKFGNRYKIFIGSDESTLAGCVMGMDSMIIATSTFIPELSFRILKNCHNKATFEKALQAQESIDTIVQKIYNYGDETVTSKAATSMITRIQLGSPRPPLKALSPEKLQSMAQTLTKLGFEV